MVMINTKPEQIDIDTGKTALIVVDMQNAFLSEGGMFDIAGHDISAAPEIIKTNRRLIDTSRASGIKVIYLQYSYKTDLSDGGGPNSPNYHKELGMIMMRAHLELRGKLLVENTWDWRIVDELTPEDGDFVIPKTRYSGFTGTNLDNILRSEGIRYTIFSGVATNICVESTARDAYLQEYWPILIEDAMNHSGPDFNRQATLWNFENVFGWVANSHQLIEALERKTN